ncbi:hypothetical protein B0H19DRAFT_1346193 [Mycena capillaripes]|nr:hypothetical protein B0H19DRAFT_1346193 [Mycena capillaripes]
MKERTALLLLMPRCSAHVGSACEKPRTDLPWSSRPRLAVFRVRPPIRDSGYPPGILGCTSQPQSRAHGHNQSDNRTKRLFGSGELLFSYRDLTLHPRHLPHDIPAFQNVTTLGCPSIHGRSQLLDSAKTYFPRLEALVGVRLGAAEDCIAALSHDFPRLGALSIESPIRIGDEFGIDALRAFTNLSELGLFHGPDPSKVLSLEELVSAAKVMLQALQSPDAKVVRVWSDRHPPGPRPVYVERISEFPHRWSQSLCCTLWALIRR